MVRPRKHATAARILAPSEITGQGFVDASVHPIEVDGLHEPMPTLRSVEAVATAVIGHNERLTCEVHRSNALLYGSEPSALLHPGTPKEARIHQDDNDVRALVLHVGDRVLGGHRGDWQSGRAGRNAHQSFD